MKTSSLIEAQLDYWVAKAEGIAFVMRGDQPATEHEFDPEGAAHEFSANEWKMWRYYRPSSNWVDGGLIIERERIGIIPFGPDGLWLGSMPGDVDYYIGADGADGKLGPTPLVAAMRAYVASKFGEEAVDNP